VQNPREFRNYYISLPRDYAHARFGVDDVTPVPWTIHSKPKLPGYVRYYKLPHALLKSAKFRTWIAGREEFSPDGNLIQLKALLRGML